MLFPKTTRYSNISCNTARLIIILVVGLIISGFASFSSDNSNSNRGGEDLRCYRSIVDRIRSGEGYYQAAYGELLSRGYPTGSIFNWRTPLLGWAFGHLPDLRIAQALAILLSLFSLWLWINISSIELSFGKVAAGSILLLGAPIYGFLPDIYLAHEFWAGTLISVSIFTYVKGWRWLAMASGILSLLIRELAFPFVTVMLLLSFHERKYREASIWAIGLVAFLILMVCHVLNIKEFFMNGNIYTVTHWITLNGWKFVLDTAKMHPYIFLLPAWLISILVPLILLGMSGWSGPLGSRISLTVGIYIISFLFVGMEFNRYWGVLYVNLLPLGVLYAPTVIRQLFCRACAKTCSTH